MFRFNPEILLRGTTEIKINVSTLKVLAREEKHNIGEGEITVHNVFWCSAARI
jgi:hypothetical protein